LIKSQEISDPRSCLNKAADDEPVFVLRAHDVIAPVIVDEWANMAESMGTPREKVTEARVLASIMRSWRDRKVPD
jgi:hypothetical protein